MPAAPDLREDHGRRLGSKMICRHLSPKTGVSSGEQIATQHGTTGRSRVVHWLLESKPEDTD